MKDMLVIGRSLALLVALAAAACDGGAGPVSSPVDPFGTEPSAGRSAIPSDGTGEAPTPPPSSTATVEELCFQACSNVMSRCPGAVGDGECAGDCAGFEAPGGCEETFKSYFRCLATASLTCEGSSIDAPACDGALFALMSCLE